LNDATSYFTDIKRIIVSTASFGIMMNVGGIFPSLWKASIVEKNISFFELLHKDDIINGLREIRSNEQGDSQRNSENINLPLGELPSSRLV
jgi:hypothetical protein